MKISLRCSFAFIALLFLMVIPLGAELTAANHDPFDQLLTEPDLGDSLHSGRILDLDITDDGRFLATYGQDGLVKLWEMPSRTSIAEFSSEQNWSGGGRVHISEDGEVVVAHGSVVNVWRMDGSRLVSDDLYGPVAVDPQGRHIASLSKTREKTEILFFEIAGSEAGPEVTGRWSLPIEDLDGYPSDMAFSSDGRYLALVSGVMPETPLSVDGVLVFDITQKERVALLNSARDRLNPKYVSFSESSSRLVVTEWDGTANVFDSSNWERVCSVSRVAGWRKAQAIPGAALFLSGGRESEVGVYSLENCDLVYEEVVPSVSVTGTSEARLTFGLSNGELIEIETAPILARHAAIMREEEAAAHSFMTSSEHAIAIRDPEGFASRLEEVVEAESLEGFREMLFTQFLHYHPGGNFGDYGEVAIGPNKVLELSERVLPRRGNFRGCSKPIVQANGIDICVPNNCDFDLSSVLSDFYTLNWGLCLKAHVARDETGKLVIYGLRY